MAAKELQKAQLLNSCHSGVRRYGIAVVLVSIAVAVRFGLRSRLGETAPMVPMTFAVFFAAYYGGMGPGLLATGLAALCAIFLFIPPIGSLHVQRLTDVLIVVSFLGIGTLISLLSEVTNRLRDKAMRAEMLLAESRYLTLVHQSPEAIVVLEEGIIRIVNTPLVEMLGPIRRQGLLGEPLVDFVHPSDQELVRVWLASLQPGVARAPSAIRFVRLDGTVIEAGVEVDLMEGEQRRLQVTLIQARSRIMLNAESGKPEGETLSGKPDSGLLPAPASI